jgi:hypothetical protein
MQWTSASLSVARESSFFLSLLTLQSFVLLLTCLLLHLSQTLLLLWLEIDTF